MPNRIALQAFVHSDADYAAPSLAALVVIRRLKGMGNPEPKRCKKEMAPSRGQAAVCANTSNLVSLAT